MMRLRTARRPKQGTSRIHDPADEKVRVERNASRLLNFAVLSTTDPEIARLEKSLSNRDDKQSGQLIKSLKEKYGVNWPTVAAIILKRFR